jgi:hypothetical protein
MKRILLVIAILAGIASNVTASPGDEIITRVAQKTFEKEFPQARFAKWERFPQNELYQVRFVYNDQALLTFIHEDGSLLATARNVDMGNLPFMVNETITRRFKDFEVLQIEELTTASELAYYVSLESDRAMIYLKVSNNGSFREISKTKKKSIAELVKK